MTGVKGLPQPSLRLRIDKEALAHNWRELDRMSGDAQTGAAVKANCYGLGVNACLPVLRDIGAARFFAAHWQEVPALLEHLNSAQIRVLHGIITAEEAAFARASGVVPVINSLHQAKVWLDSGGGLCDVMVDTGINRIGLSPHECSDELVARLDIDCLMSHLACADEDSAMNARQLSVFNTCAAGMAFNSRSLANSAGIALGEDYAFNLTRPGLALYGGVPRAEFEGVIQQVAYPQTALIQRRTIGAGESVGYNAQFTAKREMRIGVFTLGYADGFLRQWGGKTHLNWQGKVLPLLGKISMDMIVADLTDAPEMREGDWAELPYMLQHAAQQTTLSQYELLTILGTRLHPS